MKIIETERLILRPLVVTDAEDAFEWLSDPAVNRYMPYPIYTEVEAARNWIGSLTDEKNEFAFVLKDENKVIGAGSVHFVEDLGMYELGYNLNRKYWGCGYATEAAKAMLRWGHETLGVNDFYARHAVENSASGNVIKKCGFTYTGSGSYEKFDGSEAFTTADYELHLGQGNS